MVATKVCKGCAAEKSVADFARSPNMRDGLNAKCRICTNAIRVAYRKADPVRTAAIQAASYRRHREKRLAESVIYRKKHQERYKAVEGAYRSANREAINARHAELTKANPERKLAWNRAWSAANPDKEREYSRRRYERNKANPAWRLNRVLKAGMWKCLSGIKGSGRWFDLLDFTPAELRVHLERQFTKGMSWANIGQWHLDHIVPLTSFTISGPDDPELRRAWALTNLRPLWAFDNLSKGAKIVSLL